MSSRTYVVETIFRAIDKMSTTLGVINRAIGKHTRSLRAAADAVSVWSRKSSRALSSAAQWASLRISAPLTLAGGAALKAAADLEQMGIAFQTMLGDVDRGNAVLNTLIKFANVTPFQTDEVVRAGKVMLAMGVTADDLGGRLKMMGDIAAGTGQPLVELASIFGKTRAKGMMMTEELYQFAERGLPIMKILEKGLGLSGEGLLEAASKRQITFDIALKALQSMTDKGGLFYKMMEKQSKSLWGLWSTLTSKVWLFGGVVGDVMAETLGLKDAMERMIIAVDETGKGFKEWSNANPVLAKIAASLAVIVAASSPILFILAGIAWGITILATPIGMITAAIFGIAVVSAAVGWAVTEATGKMADGFIVAGAAAAMMLAPLSPILATVVLIATAIYAAYEAGKLLVDVLYKGLQWLGVFDDVKVVQKISEIGSIPLKSRALGDALNKYSGDPSESESENKLKNALPQLNPILPFAPVAVTQGGANQLLSNFLSFSPAPVSQPAKDGRVQVDINLTGDKSDSASVAVQSSGEVLTGAAKLHRGGGVGEN